MAHQTDEYCRVDRIIEATSGYIEIARRWTAKP
jgi:acetylornithine deacetylase/succinyl-diaminopimelate desuccinylase-like protein